MQPVTGGLIDRIHPPRPIVRGGGEGTVNAAIAGLRAGQASTVAADSAGEVIGLTSHGAVGSDVSGVEGADRGV